MPQNFNVLENAHVGTVIGTISGVASSLVEGVGAVTVTVVSPFGYALLFSVSNPAGDLATTGSIDLLRVPVIVLAVSVRTVFGRVGVPGNISISALLASLSRSVILFCCGHHGDRDCVQA